MSLTELSIFTGAGGGVYASKLLGHRVLGYVEWNDYCQRVIAQRIKDGIFDNAPIFTDIRTFVSEGYADAYRGMVDVVSGGFPCQPHSVAGKRLGADDERDMWPATRDVLDAVRPRYAFLENVPGLASNGYLGTVLGDLATLGYDAEWGVLGADDLGAPHIRKRIWILAYLPDAIDSGDGRAVQPEPEPRGRQASDAWRNGEARPVADADRQGQLQQEGAVSEERRRPGRRREDVANADSRRRGEDRVSESVEGMDGRQEDDAVQAQERCPRRWWDGDPADGDPEAWGAVAGLDRVATGVANRKHRLGALGNGQVCSVAATAFRLLLGRARASSHALLRQDRR
jgi:DNA (cytosine-5)-methyltransferase 1